MEAISTALNPRLVSMQFDNHVAFQDLYRAYPTPVDGTWQDSQTEYDVKSIFSNADNCPTSDDLDATWSGTINRCNYEQNGWIPPRENMPANGRSYSEGDTRKMKRQAQNRAAQRAFRERKEIKVQNLYEQIAELDAKTSKLDKENEALRSALELARAEIDRLNCMKSVSKVLESVSVDRKSPCENVSSKQGATIVLRLDLGGLANLLATEQIPKPAPKSLSAGMNGNDNTI